MASMVEEWPHEGHDYIKEWGVASALVMRRWRCSHMTDVTMRGRWGRGHGREKMEHGQVWWGHDHMVDLVTK